MTLLYSARTHDDVFDEGLMAWWRAKHRRFEFRVTYTGEDPPDGAKFTGRIPDMLNDAFADLSGHSNLHCRQPRLR